MQMDVSSVTERLEASQGSQGALANGGTTKPAAYDPEVLLRILSHRYAQMIVLGLDHALFTCLGFVFLHDRLHLIIWHMQHMWAFSSYSVSHPYNTSACRAEHAASKYLKNNYKLPKKLEESSLERLKSKLTSRPSQRIP
jgi:hypothetical protein